MADLLVGTVVNVALVGMLAPYVRIGQTSVSHGLLGRMRHAYNALPSRLMFHTSNDFDFFPCQRILINNSSVDIFSSTSAALMFLKSFFVQCI